MILAKLTELDCYIEVHLSILTETVLKNPRVGFVAFRREPSINFAFFVEDLCDHIFKGFRLGAIRVLHTYSFYRFGSQLTIFEASGEKPVEVKVEVRKGKQLSWSIEIIRWLFIQLKYCLISLSLLISLLLLCLQHWPISLSAGLKCSFFHKDGPNFDFFIINLLTFH